PSAGLSSLSAVLIVSPVGAVTLAFTAVLFSPTRFPSEPKLTVGAAGLVVVTGASSLAVAGLLSLFLLGACELSAAAALLSGRGGADWSVVCALSSSRLSNGEGARSDCWAWRPMRGKEWLGA